MRNNIEREIIYLENAENIEELKEAIKDLVKVIREKDIQHVEERLTDLEIQLDSME